MSEKAVKEVPQVVRELYDWKAEDLLPINPGSGEVLEALKEVMCGWVICLVSH